VILAARRARALVLALLLLAAGLALAAAWLALGAPAAGAWWWGGVVRQSRSGCWPAAGRCPRCWLGLPPLRRALLAPLAMRALSARCRR